MTEWETIEKVGYLTVLFLVILPILSVICIVMFKNMFFFYSYCLSGVIGFVLNYYHEKMLFNYGR